MMKLFQILSALLIVGSICFATDAKIPLSHRSILQRLASSAMTTAVEENVFFSLSAVSLLPDSTSLHAVIRNDAVNALLANNISVLTNGPLADTVISCSVQDASLSYGEAFTESLFGARKVGRTISVTVQINVTAHNGNKIFYGKKFNLSNIDTVMFSDIQNLDDPTLPVRVLSQPDLSVFDSFLEPVIITVASAVAIYLFFTIRS